MPNKALRAIAQLTFLSFVLAACAGTPDEPADDETSTSSSEALTSAVKSTSCVLPGIPTANMLSGVIQNCRALGYKYVDDYGYPNGWMTYGCGIMGPYNQQSHRLFYQCYK